MNLCDNPAYDKYDDMSKPWAANIIDVDHWRKGVKVGLKYGPFGTKWDTSGTFSTEHLS